MVQGQRSGKVIECLERSWPTVVRTMVYDSMKLRRMSPGGEGGRGGGVHCLARS